jgi:phage/plasmid-like protein (TIGR03299 family)
MAHGITTSDGVFAVREEMWHGLGTILPEHPTRAEAQELAHPWEPVAAPVYRKVIRMEEVRRLDLAGYEHTEQVPTESFEEIEDAVENARSDGKGYLGVVSKTYTPVTNGEMYDIAEAIESGAEGTVRYETGGSLFGGRKVWLLIRLKDPLVVPGDPNGTVIPYYALQNAHDGSGSFRGQATLTRIVCANTSKMADLDAQVRGTEFVFSHTKNVGGRIEEAKKALAGWRSSVTAFQDQAIYLLALGIDTRQRELFLERFVPMPVTKGVVSDRVARNIEEARNAVRSILAGPTCEGISGTAYGLVQASTEFLNHTRKAHTQESRFKRAYLDKNDTLAHAVKLVLEVSRG